MKNVFVSLVAILTSVSAYSGVPKSNGKDLVCYGTARISTPYYTCDGGYGMSDFCTDEDRDLLFSMNVIKGDLDHKISGPIFVTSITLNTPSPLQTFTADEQAMGKQLKSIVKKIRGTISYENKVATLKVQTVLGNKEITESVDFSEGTKGEKISLWSIGTVNDNLKKDFEPTVYITTSCEAGTDYNH